MTTRDIKTFKFTKTFVMCFVLHSNFYPRDAMLARVFAIATCQSVRMSDCPSVCPSQAGIVSKRRKLAS